MLVDVKIKKDNPKLECKYNHDTDACFDLRANEDFVIPARGRGAVPTGIHLGPPKGYMVQIESRSGLALNHGVYTVGGVIDCDYTGEYKVIMINHSDDDFHIEQYDRIAQAYVRPVHQANFIEVDEHEEIDGKRGSKGFGSSGVK